MAVVGEFPVFDGHNDTLLNLYLPERGRGRSFFERGEIGHLDLPRAREGRFAGGFFAIFVPTNRGEHGTPEDHLIRTENGYEVPLAPPVDPGYAQSKTIAMIALLLRLEAQSDGQFRVVRTAAELADGLQRGIVSAVLHSEGAEAIDPDLDALHVFHAAGLRSLGIVWSRQNLFGSGVPFKFPSSPDTGPGLSERGRALVRACNQLGIVIDLAHLNEQGFWDVARLSDAPLVVTHTGVHALCPSTRNVTDRQLAAVAASGGVVGIHFVVENLRADGQLEAETPVTEIVRHIEYVTRRIGIDHVALGSDFDGAVIPNEIGDVTGLPKLIGALRERGYDPASLRKLAHENWLRVLDRTWKPSSKQPSADS